MVERRLQSIGLLLVASADQVAVSISQQGLSVLSVAFKAYAHLGIGQMGLLFATVALGAVIGTLPAGAALDALGTKLVAYIAGASSLLWLGILALVLPRSFWVLEVLLALIGCGLPALSLTGTMAVSHSYQDSGHQSLALGVRQAATPLGGILAAAVFPWLVQRWSLSALLLLLAINVGGCTLGLGWMLPSRPRRPWHGRSRGALRGFSRLKGLMVASLLLSPGQYALLTYALLDLGDRWHLAMTTAGPLLAVALAGGLTTRIVMGRVADLRRPIRKLMSWVVMEAVAALAVWTLLPVSTSVATLTIVFFALGCGLDGWNALLTAWVAQTTVRSEQGTALALIGVSAFVGIMVFLPVFGFLVRQFGSYRPAWMLLAVMYAAGLVIIRRTSVGRQSTAVRPMFSRPEDGR